MRNKGKRGSSGKTNRKKEGKKDFRGQYDAKLKRDTLEADKDEIKSSSNDWRWYAVNEKLVTDYASLPFGVAAGTRMNAGTSPMLVNGVPGICVLEYIPAIGLATDENSPVNIAMRNIYSYVRHANSGHANYDAPDLMMYILAMDGVYMYQSWMKRIAKLVLSYSSLNRYYPEALIGAMGVDPISIQRNIRDFIGYINVFTTKSGSMCVPNSMSYMARHSWMCQDIYLDSMTSKAQSYLYNPVAFLQFTLTEDTTLAKSKSVTLKPSSTRAVGYVGGISLKQPQRSNNYMGSPVSSFEDLVTFGNQLLNAIIPNEDMNIMSGDILKAFGENGVVRLTGLFDNEILLPVYNQEVLMQMENTITVPIDLKATSPIWTQPWILQDTTIGGGFLKSVNTLNIAYEHIAGVNPSGDIVLNTPARRFLNMHTSVTTPAMNMVATRNVASMSNYEMTYTNGVLGGTATPLSWGSELFVKFAVYAFQYTAADVLSLNRISYDSDTIYSTSGTMQQFNLNSVAALSNFDWHPMLYTTSLLSAGLQDGSYYPIGDLDFYTTYDRQTIADMHQTALLSEFSVPQMGVLI